MSGAGTVQCPHCGTLMDEQARFCPGCGTPRTAVREQLEREAAATGVPYEQLLERERSGAASGQWSPTSAGWATQAPPAVAPPPKQRSRIWLILGIVGGLMLLVCVGCVVISLVLINRFDVNVGDSPEGNAARAQLELAANGRHEERWERLHPDQQMVVPLDLFVTCGHLEGTDSVTIIASFANNDTFIPRVGNVDARVVLYTLSGGPSTESDFVEMVRLNDEWRWTMDADEIADYQSSRCPSN